MKSGKDFIGVGVGGVIINEKEEILLLFRKKEPEAGHWCIPGGTVNFFETIEEAILREIDEEVGIKCEILDLLTITDHIIKEEKTHWVSPAFLLRLKEGTPENIEKHKHSDIKWFSINNLPRNLTITTKNALEKYFTYTIKQKEH